MLLNNVINYLNENFKSYKILSMFLESAFKTEKSEEQLVELKRLIEENETFKENLDNWFAHEGDKTLRLNYYLDPDSIVFDVGGYLGTWSTSIYCMYSSKIYIFEPVADFYSKICNKFKNNSDVKIFSFGLSNKNEFVNMNLIGDGSSEFNLTNAEGTEVVVVKDISEFIQENNIDRIDLMKINIEGGEYQLLNSLLDSGKINIVKNVQVQFHNFIYDAVAQRDAIRKRLSETHEETYCFDFVWENWKLK